MATISRRLRNLQLRAQSRYCTGFPFKCQIPIQGPDAPESRCKYNNSLSDCKLEREERKPFGILQIAWPEVTPAVSYALDTFDSGAIDLHHTLAGEFYLADRHYAAAGAAYLKPLDPRGAVDTTVAC